LDFTNNSGTRGSDTLQAAQDAIVVVGDPTQNPVTLTRSSNAISDAIPGVTLSLLQATGSSTVQVNVTRDVSAVKENIKALATAYNEVVKFINDRTTYDVTTKKGGNFFNEPTVRGIATTIRSALSSTVSGLSTLSSVGQIGFKTDRDGTITIDDSKLDTALAATYSAVKNLFINQTGTTGVAQLLNTAIDTLDDATSGSLTLRKNSITQRISKLTDDIAKKEDQVSQYETRLRAQYAALDGLLSQLKSQSSFLAARSTTTQ